MQGSFYRTEGEINGVGGVSNSTPGNRLDWNLIVETISTRVARQCGVAPFVNPKQSTRRRRK